MNGRRLRVIALLVVALLGFAPTTGLTAPIGPAQARSQAHQQAHQQATPPATRPDGTPIASSTVLAAVLDEARISCLPITNAQFAETSVAFETTDPAALRAVVARLGFDHDAASVNIATTPPLLSPSMPAAVRKASPPRGVDVAAVVTLRMVGRRLTATLSGLPSRVRNTVTDTGEGMFALLSAWTGAGWTEIGTGLITPGDNCPSVWFGPNAKTFFATTLMGNPVFRGPRWRTTRWPTWAMQLPDLELPHGWYRLTTTLSLPRKPNATLGGTFLL